MADINLLISNGTCYYDEGKASSDNVIPCGNAANDVYSCCQAGDFCLDYSICYNDNRELPMYPRVGPVECTLREQGLTSNAGEQTQQPTWPAAPTPSSGARAAPSRGTRTSSSSASSSARGQTTTKGRSSGADVQAPRPGRPWASRVCVPARARRTGSCMPRPASLLLRACLRGREGRSRSRRVMLRVGSRCLVLRRHRL